MPSFIEHLSHTTRSYRRFRSIYRVPEGHMKKWVDNTRYTASAKNLQPLRYRIVSDREMCTTRLHGLATLPIGKALKKKNVQLVTS